MADTRQRTTLGNRFRFLVRAIGLTGAAAAAVGAALSAATLPAVDLGAWGGWQSVPDLLRAAGDGAHGELAKVGAWLVAGGSVAVAIALVVELLGALVLGVGRRTAVGTSATVGIVAAVALLVIVNVYSFTHYRRYDTTRDQRFTLPPNLASELAKLRSSAPTTIVVLQMHNTFGSLSTKRDSFTSAAERQVTEKVLDLVDQFREFGPQFNVVVLDTEAFGYEGELNALTKDSPELKAAIEQAQENSIFFHANKRVQRLSFNEFMQLDKTASRESDGGRGNLVLVPQGVERFARRVLAVQERRPKVAVCVVHEALSSARADGWRARYTMAGLRKSLTDAGFDVTDVLLKKDWGAGGPRTAADTREERELERLTAEAHAASARLAAAAAEKGRWDDLRDALEKAKGKPWPERKAVYERIFGDAPDENEEPQVLAIIDKRGKRADESLKEAQRASEEAERRRAEAKRDERPLQDRRMSDMSAKLAKQLADVDLLIVPRFTVEDAMDTPVADGSVHALSREQVRVTREFMKSGKPVLACLGPITPQMVPRPNETIEDFDKRLASEIAAGTDEFERLLAERGIQLGNSLVLFDGETKALTADQFGSSPAEVPPLALAEAPSDPKLKPNPIAEAVRLTGRTAESALDLRLRALRPVALLPAWQQKQSFAAEFAFTAGASWNELQPFPRFGRRPNGARVLVYAPTYDPPGVGDPTKGSRDEERRGPFPIGVAIENRIPVAWLTEDAPSTDQLPLRSPYERQQAAAAILSPLDNTLAVGLTVAAEQVQRPTQRTVVFGSGNMFTGKDLTPPQERWLLHTINWLTHREDRLPASATAENPDWHYHRVAMSDRDRLLWRLGAVVGLPMVVAYVGLLTMMRRRMR